MSLPETKPIGDSMKHRYSTAFPQELAPSRRREQKKDGMAVESRETPRAAHVRVGRPLRYGEMPSKSTVRTQAFRAQLKDDNLVRLEAHVPRAVCHEVADIARVEGVSMAEAAQALLQYGLQRYRSGVSAMGTVSELREALLTTRSGLVELRADLCRCAVAHGNNAREDPPSPVPLDASASGSQSHPKPSTQLPGHASHTAHLPAVAAEASDAVLTQSTGMRKSPIAVFFRRRRQAGIRPKGP